MDFAREIYQICVRKRMAKGSFGSTALGLGQLPRVNALTSNLKSDINVIISDFTGLSYSLA